MIGGRYVITWICGRILGMDEVAVMIGKLRYDLLQCLMVFLNCFFFGILLILHH